MRDKLTLDEVCDLAEAIKIKATTVWRTDDGEHRIFAPNDKQRTMLKLIEFWLNKRGDV